MTANDIQDLSKALQASDTVKLVTSTDETGLPHIEENDSIHLDDDGRIVILEQDEYSLTNRNLVRGIWFGHRIVLYIRSEKNGGLKIIGKPYKALITGRRFEAYYRELQKTDKDAELSTVWLIDIEEVSDERPQVRYSRNNRDRLPLIHLDRIAKVRA